MKDFMAILGMVLMLVGMTLIVWVAIAFIAIPINWILDVLPLWKWTVLGLVLGLGGSFIADYAGVKPKLWGRGE